MERGKGRAVIKQKRFWDKLTKVRMGGHRLSLRLPIYCTGEDSELMRERKFVSLIVTLLYASKRIIQRFVCPVVHLALKYNKATEDDYCKAMRIAAHIAGCGTSNTNLSAHSS